MLFILCHQILNTSVCRRPRRSGLPVHARKHLCRLQRHLLWRHLYLPAQLLWGKPRMQSVAKSTPIVLQYVIYIGFITKNHIISSYWSDIFCVHNHTRIQAICMFVYATYLQVLDFFSTAVLGTPDYWHSVKNHELHFHFTYGSYDMEKIYHCMVSPLETIYVA